MKKILILAFAVFVLVNCTDKFNAPDNSVDPGYVVIGDTVYVQQNPIWEGFNKPKDILVGHEPFLYVADTDNDRVVMMDLSGRVLGSKSVKRPIALAQDFKLNLIVCAQFDTLINGNQVTYSAVYKMDLFSVDHQIENVKLKRLLPKSSFDFLRTDRVYTGVCVFSDNSFFVSRTGPSNNNIIDPDNGIFIFAQKRKSNGSVIDTLMGRVPLLEPEGTGLMSSNKISSLTSFNDSRRDIIVTLIGNNSFKSQWLRFVSTDDFTGYENNLAPFYSRMMEINRFGKPEDASLDDRNNIFVADAEKDSIFKFNSFGDEMESFGGPSIFNAPHAIAYFDKTLYVVDTNNNRILRFILSTDID